MLSTFEHMGNGAHGYTPLAFSIFHLYPSFTQCVALPYGPGHRQHCSMQKNHLMEDAGNFNFEVKEVSFTLTVGLCVDGNFWWEAVSHPCAKWRSPLLTRPLWFPVVGVADLSGCFNPTWAMWRIGDWGNIQHQDLPLFFKRNWNYVISESWAEMMPSCDFAFFCSFLVMYEISIVQCKSV